MIILSLLLSFFHPVQLPVKDVTVNFTFKEMKLGKPPLKYYSYDLTINNETDDSKYVIIPRYFDEEISNGGKIWGAQYDDFGSITGSTLFSESSFTIFQLKPKQKISINFTIETFDEKILKKTSTDISIGVCNKIMVDTYSFEDFMKTEEIQDDNMIYNLDGLILKKTNVKLR